MSEKFLKLLAGRSGQLVNLASLGTDVGVDAKTIGSWPSILEASFLIFRVPPHHENFGKRLTKASKVYFMDPGLLTYLLRIESAAQLERDPLVGQVFENLVVLEILKARYNAGLPGGLSYFRDSHGHELDLLLKVQGELRGIEIKSSQTYHSSFAKTLDWFQESIASLKERYVIYSGPERRFSNGTTALHFYDASQVTQD